MQKLRRDKGFQQKPDICLHCGHCFQLSHRVVFVFARVRPPRMCSGARFKKKRGKKKIPGHCQPQHILYGRQAGGGRMGAAGRERRGRCGYIDGQAGGCLRDRLLPLPHHQSRVPALFCWKRNSVNFGFLGIKPLPKFSVTPSPPPFRKPPLSPLISASRAGSRMAQG